MRRQFAIGFDGDELACHGQPLQRGAQVGTATPLTSSARSIMRQRSKLRAATWPPFWGRLWARQARCPRVTHQAWKIHHQCAGTPTRPAPGHVAALAAHGVDDGDALVHQLRGLCRRWKSPRRPWRVRLRASVPITSSASTPGKDSTGQPSKRTTLMNGFDLRAQVSSAWAGGGPCSRHTTAFAEGGAAGIEHAHGKWAGCSFAAPTACSPCPGWPGGRAVRVAWHGAQVRHGVVGAVEVAGAIDQHQVFFGHGRRLSQQGAPYIGPHARPPFLPASFLAPCQPSGAAGGRANWPQPGTNATKFWSKSLPSRARRAQQLKKGDSLNQKPSAFRWKMAAARSMSCAWAAKPSKSPCSPKPVRYLPTKCSRTTATPQPQPQRHQRHQRPRVWNVLKF